MILAAFCCVALVAPAASEGHAVPRFTVTASASGHTSTGTQKEYTNGLERLKSVDIILPECLPTDKIKQLCREHHTELAGFTDEVDAADSPAASHT